MSKRKSPPYLVERENRELRQANDILRKASASCCCGGARLSVEVMMSPVLIAQEHGVSSAFDVDRLGSLFGGRLNADARLSQPPRQREGSKKGGQWP